MPLCETCRNVDFVAVSESRPNDLWFPHQPFPSDLGIFAYECNDDIITSGSIRLYHETVDDLKAGAQLCDLCRIVMASVEKVLAGMRNSKEDNLDYIVESHQLWMCGTLDHDGIEIMSFSGNPKDRMYLFCGLRLSVAEGEYQIG